MNTITQSTPTAEEAHRSSARQAEIEAAVRSLRTLLEDDEQEQRETFDYLKKSLDEDRPSHRKLFPSQ